MCIYNLKITYRGYNLFHLSLCRQDEASGCKDISVSGCFLDEKYIIQEVLIFTIVDQCQYYCNQMNNCIIFRFDGDKCTLMRKDDHKDCLITGGPPVR